MTENHVTRGKLGRRIALVGQPYWFGNMRWTWWKALIAFAAVGATVLGLNVAVAAGSDWFVSLFASLDPLSLQSILSSHWLHGLLAVAAVAATCYLVSRYRRKPAAGNPAAQEPSARRERFVAWTLLIVVLAFMVSVNVLNVVISHVSREFTTALNLKQEATYWHYLYIYASVFIIGIPIVELNRWFRRLLGNHWRRWLTYHLLGKYFKDRAYYRLNFRPEIDNPEERIHQDVFNFTTGALSLVITLLGSLITLVSFVGILWSISQFLTWAVIGYAAAGTVFTILVGRILVAINSDQLRYEADFRFGITHVRQNTESVAFFRGEEQEMRQVKGRFARVYRNFLRLIGAQRNLGFFTTGFEYVTIIIPMALLAGTYFAGDIEVGVITQASFAFRMVLNSLAVIIDEFTAITTFAANAHRIGQFVEALDEKADPNRQRIVTHFDDRVGMKGVTLLTPDRARTLAKDLSFEVPQGGSLLIVGPSGSGKSSVLRVVAGLWDEGSGTVIRPDPNKSEHEMMFLPQKPYMILGTLKQQLLYPRTNRPVSEEELRQVLNTVNLPRVADAFPGGFDADKNWADVLSLGEQQRLAMARLLLARPKVAILDEATSALDVTNEELIYKLLVQGGTTFISVGHRPTLTRYHDHVLELTGDGSWKMWDAAEYAKAQQ